MASWPGRAADERPLATRPLTDKQERALVSLAGRASDLAVDWRTLAPRGINVKTAAQLNTFGLIEAKVEDGAWVARITFAGLELLRSMGD